MLMVSDIYLVSDNLWYLPCDIYLVSDIQSVSGGIVNILGGGSVDYSE